MGKLLYSVLDLFANNFIRQFLVSLGIGIASGAAIYLLIQAFLDNAVSLVYSMPYLPLLGLFGIDKALSIYLGAILTRASMEATFLRFTKR